jgi:secretion/DNA translocation related CpaE-like protein
VDRTVVLHESEEVLIELLSDTVLGVAGHGQCIAVLGACGGAGASVLASSIAFAAAKAPSDVLLVDCDPWGAGLDVLLGIETEPGLRWTDLAAPSGRLQVDALRHALPGVNVGQGRVAVLCHGRSAGSDISPNVLDVVLDAGRRMSAATVIDLPRQPGPAADRVLEQADLIVLVAPADVRGCWAADRICSRIRSSGPPPVSWSAVRLPVAWVRKSLLRCLVCRCSRGCGRIRRWPVTWRSAWRSAPIVAGRSRKLLKRCCRRCGPLHDRLETKVSEHRRRVGAEERSEPGVDQ